MKLKIGDEVKVVAGKEKGKSGKIEKIFPKENKVLLPGLNQYKRHMKARSQGQKSEIVIISKPLAVANVMLICPRCRKLARIAFSLQKGGKMRVCSKCKKEI